MSEARHILVSPEQLGRLTQRLAQAEFPLEITVRPWKRKRTLPQNRRYFGAVVRQAAATVGYSESELHELLKQMFCPPKPVKIGDQEYLIRSTKLLSVDEHAQYQTECEAFLASECDVVFR